MGLDQFALATYETPRTDTDFKVGNCTEFYYWRKHPDLHGWMERLYVSKGGTQEFNCVPVRLTLEDLDRLEADIHACNLPLTKGFFFGDSDGSEKSGDVRFIIEAREYLNRGMTVFYDSWW